MILKGIGMEKLELLYEGKTKNLYKTDSADIGILSFTDEITAMGGEKRETIVGKGAVNNQVSNRIFQILSAKGIPTHYVEEFNETETAVKRASTILLKVVVRNYSAGKFAERTGIEEGVKLKMPVLEFAYKNEKLGEPMINGYYALALDIITQDEIDKIATYAFKINEILIDYFGSKGIDLIDFKIEFGRYHGEIILIDEISPDTCRLWDKQTHVKLDKDRFKRDLGNVQDAYQEVFKRLGIM